MKIVLALNYYTPYVSGLTNVARDVAEGLARKGHEVVVVTTQHEATLPQEQRLNGVRVIRHPVAVRIGKGVIAPGLVRGIVRECRDADVLNIHAPMLEAGLVAAAVRRSTEARVVFTYQCDIAMPPGLVNRLQSMLMDVSTRRAARASHAVVASSADYAQHSRVSNDLLPRLEVIAPGCILRERGEAKYRSGTGLHVGFLGRIVEEKGIDFLVRGFRKLEDPDARLLIAGDFANIAGGSIIERVRREIESDPRIDLLGFLSDDELADFYGSIDAFALTSINSFEAFGIVQVEAMMMGIPVIASDMPGVRMPARETGMGIVVARRDADAITAALEQLPEHVFPSDGAQRARDLFHVDVSTDAYEDLFQRLSA